jgi:DUF1365 family protein
MNPVSFYYCYDSDGQFVETIVAEVNNTPWGEQHCYVLDGTRKNNNQRKLQFEIAKEFHVSPFMDLDMSYQWRLTQPADRLLVHIENEQSGEKLFDATLMMDRREINSISLAFVLLRFPFMTAKILLAIYYEALRLWLKKIPFVQHPKYKETPTTAK